jgi:hypothetical protein
VLHSVIFQERRLFITVDGRASSHAQVKMFESRTMRE